MRSFSTALRYAGFSCEDTGHIYGTDKKSQMAMTTYCTNPLRLHYMDVTLPPFIYGIFVSFGRKKICPVCDSEDLIHSFVEVKCLPKKLRSLYEEEKNRKIKV